MANVALEAMAAGRPVIVSRCGGVDRYVDAACGWTIDIDDREALTAAIVAAAGLTQDALAAMGRAAFDLVRREFSLDAAVNTYLELFRSVLQQDKN
jgi:glycosyltransferase involved in cell wall biosynthesis